MRCLHGAKGNFEDKNTAMFRNLISELSYSPTVLKKVATYKKQLKRESKVLRRSLILTLLSTSLLLFYQFNVPGSPIHVSSSDLALTRELLELKQIFHGKLGVILGDEPATHGCSEM